MKTLLLWSGSRVPQRLTANLGQPSCLIRLSSARPLFVVCLPEKIQRSMQLKVESMWLVLGVLNKATVQAVVRGQSMIKGCRLY